jgi:hypothetical protein
MFEAVWLSRCTHRIKDLLPWRKRAPQSRIDPVDEAFRQLRDYCEAHSNPASLEDAVIRQVLTFATDRGHATSAAQQPDTQQKAPVPEPAALVRARAH